MKCPGCGKEMEDRVETDLKFLDKDGRYRVYDCKNDGCTIVMIKVYEDGDTDNTG